MQRIQQYLKLCLTVVGSFCFGEVVQAQYWQHSISVEYDISYVPKWDTFSTLVERRDRPLPGTMRQASISVGVSYGYLLPSRKWELGVNFNYVTFCHVCSHDLPLYQGRFTLSRTIPQWEISYQTSALLSRVFTLDGDKRWSIALGPTLRLGSEGYNRTIGGGISGMSPIMDRRAAKDWGLTTRISYDKLRERLPHMKKVPWHKYFGWSIWLQGRYYFLMRKYYRWPDEFVTGAPTTFSLGVSLRYYFGVREG